MHYFFDSEKSVRNFLQNISNKLVKGGYFVSTFADFEVILGKISKSTKKQKNMVYWENSHCSVIFE